MFISAKYRFLIYMYPWSFWKTIVSKRRSKNIAEIVASIRIFFQRAEKNCRDMAAVDSVAKPHGLSLGSATILGPFIAHNNGGGGWTHYTGPLNNPLR